MSVDRRTVLKATATATAGAAAAGPFAGLVAAPAEARKPPRKAGLVPVRDKRDGQVRLHLPRGFNYRSFHDTEQPVVLTDGTRLPGRHDGMAAFDGPGGTVLLVRNHEITNIPTAQTDSPVFGPGRPYDAWAGGGTTTVQVTKQGKPIRSFTSLNGTMFNCSGGAMPWGAWVTCEETINGPDVGPDFQGQSNARLEQPHGFVYEVPVSHVPGEGQSTREPIRNAGRFSHEAVSFDPVDGYLYLTEDDFGWPSGFYRYQPPSHPMEVGRLEDGGTLQMLKVRGVTNAHLEASQVNGQTYDVEWVDIDEPWVLHTAPGQPVTTTNDQALTHVARQGWAQGAAYFSRLEGQTYDDGIVYFTSTQGGGEAEAEPVAPDPNGFGRGSGQVWAYHTRSQRLRVVFQSPGPLTLDLPDNITTSPRGTLVVCEDNVSDNFVRGLSQDGQIWDIALNRLRSSLPGNADRSNDEFAGSTFSPDGHTLFVNIQASRGLTFAIWGPWRSIGV